MGRGDAGRRRRKAQERAAVLKGKPLAGAAKKPVKHENPKGDMTRAMRKMLLLQALAKGGGKGGGAAGGGKNQLAPRGAADAAQQQRQQGGSAPADQQQQHSATAQQRAAPAAGAQQQQQQGLSQNKRLKDKKRDFLKQKKLKKKGKADPLLTDKEIQLAAAAAASAPAFGEQAHQPLKMQLKRKHWAGEGSDAAIASRRCTEIFKRQMAEASRAAAAAEATRDDAAALPQQPAKRQKQAGAKGKGGKGQGNKAERGRQQPDEAVRQQLIDAYRQQKQQRLEEWGKVPLLSATTQSLAALVAHVLASIRLVDLEDVHGASDSSSVGDSGGGSGGSGSLAAVLVDKLSMRFFKYQRGELVVLKSPEQPRRRLVRRLVGLEGDFVSVAGGRTERLPKGSCWAEADAGLKAVGGDSRVAWGAVPLALVEGRATHVLWPPSLWGALQPQPCPSGTQVVGKGGSLEFLHPPSDQDDWWS